MPSPASGTGDHGGARAARHPETRDGQEPCQRGEVGPGEHEPVLGCGSHGPALLMRDNEEPLLGCRLAPRPRRLPALPPVSTSPGWRPRQGSAGIFSPSSPLRAKGPAPSASPGAHPATSGAVTVSLWSSPGPARCPQVSPGAADPGQPLRQALAREQRSCGGRERDGLERRRGFACGEGGLRRDRAEPCCPSPAPCRSHEAGGAGPRCGTGWGHRVLLLGRA